MTERALLLVWHLVVDTTSCRGYSFGSILGVGSYSVQVVMIVNCKGCVYRQVIVKLGTPQTINSP